MKIIAYMWISLAVLLFHFCSDNYSTEIRDSIINEFSNNQNVVSVNHYYDTEDWKNVMDFDVMLKNDVRMYIAGCKRDKNGEFIYETIYDINDWMPVEIVHYMNSDTYGFNHMNDRLKEFLGNDSLTYLLDNYKKVYDFCMSIPEIDCINYKDLKAAFNNIPTEFMYTVYDRNTDEVIGVGKLYRNRRVGRTESMLQGRT